MENQVRALLDGKGWGDRADVDEALHWAGRKPALRKWIRERGLWPAGQPKPGDPKGAVDAALWEVKIPPSSSIFLALARSVSVERCVDPAFERLRGRLKSWFPV